MGEVGLTILLALLIAAVCKRHLKAVLIIVVVEVHSIKRIVF